MIITVQELKKFHNQEKGRRRQLVLKGISMRWNGFRFEKTSTEIEMQGLTETSVIWKFHLFRHQQIFLYTIY